MKRLLIVSLTILFVVSVQAHTDKIGTIGTAASLYGRDAQLTGGYDGYREHHDHYSYDLFGSFNWTKQPDALTQMFKERSLHSSEVYQDFLFLFGRVPGVEIISLTSAEHNTSWPGITENMGPGPSVRVGHATVQYNHQFYLFGGVEEETGVFKNDLWEATVIGPNVQWTLLQERAPLPARAFHSAIVYQDSIYIFGGSGINGVLRNDVWRYDILLKHWVRCFINEEAPTPHPREAHIATYYGDEAMWVFGGRGIDGFLNDMWRFDLQEERWYKVFEGQVVPQPRAHFSGVVIDERWIIFGGQVGDERATTMFWSPETRYIPIYHPDDYSGEVWSFNFHEGEWEYDGCMPLSDNWHWTSKIVPAEQCRSHHKPWCPNDCSGNGVCVADKTCICRGQWTNDDCSWNVCDFDLHRGYSVDLMDRVLISESILKIGKELSDLKKQLLHIRERIPSWSEFISCIHAGEQDLSQVMVMSASVEGVRYHTQCMTNSLLPIFSEFNEVLINSNMDEPEY